MLLLIWSLNAVSCTARTQACTHHSDSSVLVLARLTQGALFLSALDVVRVLGHGCTWPPASGGPGERLASCSPDRFGRRAAVGSTLRKHQLLAVLGVLGSVDDQLSAGGLSEHAGHSQVIVDQVDGKTHINIWSAMSYRMCGRRRFWLEHQTFL